MILSVWHYIAYTALSAVKKLLTHSLQPSLKQLLKSATIDLCKQETERSEIPSESLTTLLLQSD